LEHRNIYTPNPAAPELMCLRCEWQTEFFFFLFSVLLKFFLQQQRRRNSSNTWKESPKRSELHHSANAGNHIVQVKIFSLHLFF
jgi:hypothetical protein